MKKIKLTILLIGFSTLAAFAHQGVQNAAVKARMNGMSIIAENVKILGDMAKGKAVFKADRAKIALDNISTEAARIPLLFKDPATDPKSEAVENIWTQFDEFTAIAKDLQEISSASTENMDTIEDVQQVMKDMGANCKACHSKFRR